MQCAEAQRFVDAYLDGELDLQKSLEIETHLADCPSCRQLAEHNRALKTAIKAGGLYYAAPSGLQARVMQSLPQEKSVPARRWTWHWRTAGFAAVMLLFLFAIIVYRFTLPAQNDLLAQEVVSSHIRSLLAEHLFDVRSSDKHTVKPWFSGKIDYAPGVADMTQEGFPLVGGRLDYLDNRPVAALVYRRQKHLINLYLWPAAKEADLEMKRSTLRGYNLWHWTKFGTTYWAVSDLNSGELQEFALHIQKQSSPER